MRVLIVGGGVAGLWAAHALLARGCEPVVLEAAPWPGGKLLSRRDGGWLTEDGPHFVARALPEVLAAAGLEEERVLPAGRATRWVALGGRAFRAPSPGLLLRAGAGRALLEPLLARPPHDEASLAELLIARFGRRAGALAGRLLASGVYAGDPARLSALESFPRLGALARGGSILRAVLRGVPPAPLWSLRDGLGSLPLALAARLGTRVRTRFAIEALEPRRSGWLAFGPAGSVEADAAVLAVPPPAAARLVAPFAPAAAALLAGIELAPVAVVHLGVPAAGLPEGFGLLDGDGSLRLLGTLFPSARLPGRSPKGFALLSSIVGGARRPADVELPDDALISLVREDLRRAIGLRADPVHARVARWPVGIPQIGPGHGARLQAARAALPATLALAGAGFGGVGVPDAFDSASEAARQLSGG